MLPIDRIDSLAEGAAIEIALGRDPKRIIASTIHAAATEAVAGFAERRDIGVSRGQGASAGYGEGRFGEGDGDA